MPWQGRQIHALKVAYNTEKVPNGACEGWAIFNSNGWINALSKQALDDAAAMYKAAHNGCTGGHWRGQRPTYQVTTEAGVFEGSLTQAQLDQAVWLVGHPASAPKSVAAPITPGQPTCPVCPVCPAAPTQAAPPSDQAPLPPGMGLTITPATSKVVLPKGAKFLGTGTILQNPAPYRLPEGVMVWIHADEGGKPFEASLRLMDKADQTAAAPGDHVKIYKLSGREIVAISSDK